MGTRDEWNSYKMFEGLNIWGTPEFAGAAVGALDLSSLVPGTELDGSLIKAGELASPIVFSTPSQFGQKLYLQNNATSGTLTGIKLRIDQNGIGGGATGLDIENEVSALTTGSISVFGLKVASNVAATGVLGAAGRLHGAWIETTSVAGASILGDVWTLWVRDAVQDAVAGQHWILHITKDGATVPDAAIAFRGNCTRAFYFYQTGTGVKMATFADDITGTPEGMIKVWVEGYERKIQLYA